MRNSGKKTVVEKEQRGGREHRVLLKEDYRRENRKEDEWRENKEEEMRQEVKITGRRE